MTFRTFLDLPGGWTFPYRLHSSHISLVISRYYQPESIGVYNLTLYRDCDNGFYSSRNNLRFHYKKLFV